MLGIALGAFTQGFAQGVDLGTKIHDIRKQRKMESTVQGISAQTKADYDTAVSKGEAAPDDYMSFFTQHAVPKISNEYLLDGDPEKAQVFLDWAETTGAKNGAKKFMSGLSKLQNGDVQGGVDDMVKAANVQGYGIDGKVTAAEYYDEEAGAVTGYKLTFTGSDGEERVKNVATGDLASFFANLANPKAAFEMEQADKAARSKADLEVETHTRKKTAEKELGVGTGGLTPAQYQNAIQEERKAIENAALTDPELEGKTSAEKEAMAKEIVDARFGGMGKTAAPGPQVAVDPDTGEPVAGDQTPTTDAMTPPPAEDTTPVPDDEELGAASTPADATGPVQAPAPVAGVVAPTPAATTSEVAPGQKQQYLAQATQLMKQGGDAQKIGRALIAAGIPPEQWPQDVKMAAQQSQLGVSR